MTLLTCGVVLPPNFDALATLEPVIEECGHVAVTPETLWWEEEDGSLTTNAFHANAIALRTRLDLPVVAHCVALDLCGLSLEGEARRARWMRRLSDDRAALPYAWLTEHLGATFPDGEALALPLPVPMTEAMAGVVRARLAGLQSVVPRVGVENSAVYHLLGDALDEPAFLASCVAGDDMHVLLDIENLLVMAANFGFDPDAWLARLDLSKVIEIHLAGGGESDPKWLPGGERFRLDAHDRAISEDAWTLLERVLPRCTGLRGITLERMEGTLEPGDGLLVRDELRRARRLVELSA